MFDRRGGFPNYLKLGVQWLRIPRINPLDLVDQNKSVIGFNLSYLFGKRELLREGIEQMVRWLDEGRLLPPHVTSYPAARVADAQRALESGQTTGKLVLTW
jgi:NADPH:quinone reductase-like Zn-dependent oxidoreductase